MAVNPDFTFEYTMLDLSGEKSTVTVHSDQTIVDYATKITALKTAIDTISLCTGAAFTQATKTVITNSRIGAGQREDKYLVEYQDNTSLAKGSFSIPGRDDATYSTVPGTDYYDLTETDMAALVTAIQAVVRSPDNHAVTVTGIKAVGRNI